MKTDRILHDFYAEKINRASVPAAPYPVQVKEYRNNPFFNRNMGLKFAFAFTVMLSFFPFIYQMKNPSTLAVKAAIFCNENQINNKIHEGLIEIQKMSFNSLFSEKMKKSFP